MPPLPYRLTSDMLDSDSASRPTSLRAPLLPPPSSRTPCLPTAPARSPHPCSPVTGPVHIPLAPPAIPPAVPPAARPAAGCGPAEVPRGEVEACSRAILAAISRTPGMLIRAAISSALSG